MKKQLTVLTLLLLSIAAYAGNNKKAAKQKQQELVKPQQAAPIDTTTQGKGFGGWGHDPRLDRSMYVAPAK